MAYNLSAFAGAGAQFFDSNGDILSGGLLYVYTAGTTTPATTWTSNSGASTNVNPIVLDSAGRTPNEIWVNSGVTYKFVLKTSTGTLIGTYDNIPAIDDPTVFNNLITVTGTNTLIGTSTPPYTAYVAGMTISFVAANTNTNAVTIDVDGLGAKNIYTGSAAPLSGGELVAGRIIQLEYDGTRFQLQVGSIADGSVTTAKIANGAVTPAKLSTGGPSWDASGNFTAAGNFTATGSVKATATGVIFPDSTTQATAAPASVDVQTFNSTATWTKPSGGYRMARIQVWGGGGGGARASTANAAPPGGGGAYNEVTVPLSYLAASFTATVGSGGAGATSTNSGATGGQSSVPLATAVNGRTTIDAYGGGGGGVGGGSGGGGGGQLSAGLSGLVGTPGSPIIYVSGGPFGIGSDNSAMAAGGFWNGGGGGGSSAYDGANSIFGGGGGASTGRTAGTSLYGGAGGTNSANGTQPGGGGGSSTTANVNGGNGGAGRIIITCW